MKRIAQLSEQIREHTYKWNSNIYERHYKDHPDEWAMLCVAMDTLDDTCLALEDYETQGLGHGDNEKYLRLYGLLQSIFLQQDAIRYLYEIFMNKSWNGANDSAWMKIRDLRNLTVGHPINKDRDKSGIKRTTISRVTIRDGGFQLIIWNKDKNEDQIVDVNFKSQYESYKSEAIIHLEAIHQAQITKWGTQANV